MGLPGYRNLVVVAGLWHIQRERPQQIKGGNIDSWFVLVMGFRRQSLPTLRDTRNDSSDYGIE